MAGEIQLNGTTALTESGGAVTLNNVDSATNRTNLGLGTAATSASTDFASSSRTITAGTGLSGGGDLSANRTISVDYASTSEVQGTHTTGTITSGTTSLTVASGSGISNGDYVVGEGIVPGTTVSSGGGTTSITLSANAAATLSSDPVSFYTANKSLSPGLVAGGLCRAWVNFNGTGTVAIRAAHNVSSITDNGGLGNYTVNLATAMPDAHYAVSFNGYNSDTSGVGDSGEYSGHVYSKGTGGFNVSCLNLSGANAASDFVIVDCAIFR